jgi:hypothetical protein
MMTPTDRLDGGPADYRVPTSDFLNPGRSVPMPTPRVFPNEGPIPTGSGVADTGATIDTGRRPSSHPALQG